MGKGKKRKSDAVAEAEPAVAPAKPKLKINKRKVLVLSSRGISHRQRHLMNDTRDMLPHHKKDVKLDDKDHLSTISEICEMKSCDACIFFEARKHGKDLYMWLAKTPFGPSAKFHVLNIHTMDELKLVGNSLKGARPFMYFDAAFDTQPHLQLLKEMFQQIYATPKAHLLSKPFIDRIACFYYLNGKIWFRTYQISVAEGKDEEPILTEIGPRFVLNLVRIFGAPFGGPTLYQNPNYVSPNTMRSELKRQSGDKHSKAIKDKKRAKQRAEGRFKPSHVTDTVFD